MPYGMDYKNNNGSKMDGYGLKRLTPYVADYKKETDNVKLMNTHNKREGNHRQTCACFNGSLYVWTRQNIADTTEISQTPLRQDIDTIKTRYHRHY